MSAYLIDYPFAGRLFPSALEVLRRLTGLGPTVILSDGDVVFQPRKVERAGLSDAVDGRVLIYIHKEEALDDVERRFPAEHYVLVDDKPRILAAVKRFWGDRVTTVFARQGSYARDAQIVGHMPAPADVTIERIGDLLSFDLRRLQPALAMPAPELEPMR
jgi:FMN phosphatase YigB (HAD superfamily)